MTICIAALCTWESDSVAVIAADRMLSLGDTEFDPDHPKLFHLGDRIAALVSGDISTRIEVCRATQVEIRQRSITDVPTAATIFAEMYGRHRRRLAEARVLAPLGLTSETFVQRQRDMSPDIVRETLRQLSGADLRARAIIAGCDSSGSAHIYVVSDPGIAACYDALGFAAVGAGQRHAESQFMFQKHTPQQTFGATLLLTLSAAKRAEVAPGVGKTTDLWYITANGIQPVSGAIYAALEAGYNHTAVAASLARDEAARAVEAEIHTQAAGRNGTSRRRSTSSQGAQVATTQLVGSDRT